MRRGFAGETRTEAPFVRTEAAATLDTASYPEGTCAAEEVVESQIEDSSGKVDGAAAPHTTAPDVAADAVTCLCFGWTTDVKAVRR